MQSAYVNTIQEPHDEEEEAKENDNIYCINNKDMSNASKIRLIKKIEKKDLIINENEESMEQVQIKPKVIPSKTDATKSFRNPSTVTIGDSSGSFLVDLNNRFGGTPSKGEDLRLDF
jgi:hypothetical protein